MDAIKKSNYDGKVDIGLDVAASEFFQNGKYNLGFKSGKDNFLSKEEMLALYRELIDKYPIISVEDPFYEEDFNSFALLHNGLQERGIQVVGDDLTVTNSERIKFAVEKKSCNALLLKINQIRTVSEAIDAFKLARDNQWKIMVSHRSGETTDDFIADFAVGVGAEQVKFGAPARGERVVKYNRLLFLEKDI